MELTAIALIYSPWGRQSGAHTYPATTLTFLRLGKVMSWDATFYIAAQFLGNVSGALTRRRYQICGSPSACAIDRQKV